MLILGSKGYNRLLLGRETNINQVKTKTFTVDASVPEGAIYPGDLLIFGSKTQVYTKPDKTQAATTYANKIAGIALATNVKLDTKFPQSDVEVGFEPGQQGACVVQGEVVVKLHGNAPTEGADVYYDVANAAFTTSSSNTLQCVGYKFSGITEGNLTVVNRLY